MKLAFAAALLMVSVFADSGSAAPMQDVKGSSDHPVVGRYEGSVIKTYAHKNYEELRLLDKQLVKADRKLRNERNSIPVSGKYWVMSYHGPEHRSGIEVYRNYVSRLESQGLQLVFHCRGAECDEGSGAEFWHAARAGQPIGSNYGSQQYALFKKGDGELWVAMLLVERSDTRTEAVFEIVESKAMETDKVVFIDSSAMQKSLDSLGRVSLYGILFDFDKATIRPESAATLSEIAKYLKANSSVKLVVAGHTDAKGAFDYNLDLSSRRAAAVVEALRRDYGIAGARLTAFGAGMASPVASNDTEEGRQKNRRVELVKRLD